MTRPLVSVVIPTYNRARDLERALRSLCAQTYADWEAIVVDNHSTDDTNGVVHAFANPRIALHKIHNGGVIAASRNLGIRRARGEYVAFLDSDDWWHPQKLEASVHELERGADIVYHDLFLVRRAGQKWFWRRAKTRPVRRPVFEDLVRCGNALTNSSVVVRRDALTGIGGLSEDRELIAAEDYDAWLRLARVSDKFVRIPRTLGYYWVGGGSVSSPERVIQTLGAIATRYSEALDAYCGGTAVWMDYALGRAYFRLGRSGEAHRHLRAVEWRRAAVPINLKAAWMRALLAFRRPATGGSGA